MHGVVTRGRFASRLLALALVAVLVPAPAFAARTRVTKPEWLRRPGMVAHALGGLSVPTPDGGTRVYTYTNSREAFEQNYAKGYRVFEVDLRMTSDGVLVARHDWSAESFANLGQRYPGHVPTYAEFMATKIHGRFTPLSVADLAQLMREHPNAYIITDTKTTAVISVQKTMRELCRQLGPDRDVLAKRIIIQIYDEWVLGAVRSVYPFENIAYTLHKTSTTRIRALRFAKKNGIQLIVCKFSAYDRSLASQIHAMGMASAVHSTNSASEVRRLRGYGTDLVFSHSLSSKGSAYRSASSMQVVGMGSGSVTDFD